MAPKVLFIYNDPKAPEGVLGQVFTELGFDVDVLNVVPLEQAGDPAAARVTFPAATDYDVIVPLGSRWSVYDDALRAAWVDAEMVMVRDAVSAGVGVLGVCFGGQLVAQALGGTVGKAAVPELGWYDVTETGAAGSDLVMPGPWFEWHSDCFTPPPGAVELARTAHASQAFVLGTALGMQFHPELDIILLDQWLDDEKGPDGDVARLGIDVPALRARTRREQQDAARRLRILVSGFLDRVARPVCQS